MPHFSSIIGPAAFDVRRIIIGNSLGTSPPYFDGLQAVPGRGLQSPTAQRNAMSSNLAELLAQKAAIEREIQEAQRASRAAAVAKVRELMAAHTITAADLTAAALSASRVAKRDVKAVAPKYRHPGSGQTWTGRGLKPRWLTAEIAAGKTANDFLI
jgi:DNA-binding protein H-NS